MYKFTLLQIVRIIKDLTSLHVLGNLQVLNKFALFILHLTEWDLEKYEHVIFEMRNIYHYVPLHKGPTH